LSVYLAVLTRARANTILNIRKKDFDLGNNTLSLYNFKSSKQYKLTLNTQSINWFRDKIFPYFNNSNEYIIRPIHEFNRKNPPQVLNVIPKKVYNIMDSLFNKDLDKQNNIDRDKIVNFHTIRRSIATNLVKGGTSV
jgi:integrase